MCDTSPSSDVYEFINGIPKAELHLHLEGAIPWSSVRANSDHPLSATPPWWEANFRFQSFDEFSNGALGICYTNNFDTLEKYKLVASQVFKGLERQNVRYAEISFGLTGPYQLGLRIPDIVTAIKDVVPASMDICVIAAFSREHDLENLDQLATLVLNLPQLDGIDIYGNEAVQDISAFADIYAEANKRGLLTKAHAGEFGGPLSVAQTLNLLAPLHRIEHGTRAAEDEELLTRLVSEGIVLDLCPMSNVKLQVVKDIASHPIRKLYDFGIPVTVSTDDPTVFGLTLTEELLLLIHYSIFSPIEIAQIQINAFKAARMTKEKRNALINSIESAIPSVKEFVKEDSNSANQV
jgi:adenosine deaminase